MAIRLKGKPPHPDWPVHYPYDSPDRDSKECPIRAIDDVENYLVSIITKGPPPLIQTDISIIRPIYDAPYIQRHVHVHERVLEIEGDVHRVHPAAWVPPQVLNDETPENA